MDTMDSPEWLPDKAIEELTLKRALAKIEDSLTLAGDLFKDCAPIAAMSICHMAIHSPTDNVRLAAAKHVVDRAMGTPAPTPKMEREKPIWEELFDSVTTTKQSEI